MLTFTTNRNTHTAIGKYGTHYTFTADTDEQGNAYFYMDSVNVEFDTYAEAVAYCEALEATEVAANKCHQLGVRVFEAGFADECDIRHHKVDEIQYVFCPTDESAKAFIEFTEHCVECYFLTHATDYHGISNTMRHLFEYQAHSDSFARCDDTICAIISQLVK